MTCKTTRVANALGERLFRPGCIDKERALVRAHERVESLRDNYVLAIPKEIAALEAMISGIAPKQATGGELKDVLDRADRLLVLSGTFGFTLLDAVVKSFCDLAIAMLEEGAGSVDALRVHVPAMWLAYHNAANLTDSEAETVLNELAKMHAHFKAA